jgi:hypothetical protein
MVMNASTWHADNGLLAAYTEGRLDAVVAASLERHLDSCSQCRSALPSVVPAAVLASLWRTIRDTVEVPHRPLVVRVAQRLGLTEPTAVVLAATTSLRIAWLSSAFVALGFAVVAATVGGGSFLWPFLTIAPLIPVLGVAAAYGPSDDPFEVLAVTAPYGRTRLILVRTLAVLVTSVPGACLLGLAVPGPTWVAAAWLGPALAMVPLMLAMASLMGPRTSSAVMTILWCGVVLGSVRRFPATWPVEAHQQVLYLVLATVATVVLLVRSRQTRQMGVAL